MTAIDRPLSPAWPTRKTEHGPVKMCRKCITFWHATEDFTLNSRYADGRDALCRACKIERQEPCSRARTAGVEL